MRFCVSVPVLSVQMTDAHPSVSTLGRWRTSVCRFAMRRAAMAIASVTVGSSPSGTFATMMPMAKTRLTRSGQADELRRSRTRAAPIATASAAISRLRAAISFCSGDGASTVVWVRWAILPERGVHPGREYQRLCFTARHRRAGQQDVPASQQVRLPVAGRASRETGRASPVIVALLTRTPNASTSRQSAGTSSPARQKDHVAGHDVLGREHDGCAVRAASYLVRKQSLQRRHRLLGAVLLPEREGAVDENHGDDGSRKHRHSLTRHLTVGDERQERSDPQQAGEEVGELREEADVREVCGSRSMRFGPNSSRRAAASGRTGRLVCCAALRRPRREGADGSTWNETMDRHMSQWTGRDRR